MSLGFVSINIKSMEWKWYSPNNSKERQEANFRILEVANSKLKEVIASLEKGNDATGHEEGADSENRVTAV